MTTIEETGSGTEVRDDRRPRAPWVAKAAAAALVLGALGNLGQALVWQLAGGRPRSVDEQLAFADVHGGQFALACLLGTLAVPFMAAGFLAAARLLGRRARRAGTVAAVLLLLGMWGFQAIQVAETIQLASMLDGAVEAATWMDTLEEQPLLMVFGAPFLLGTPLGLLVLTAGALRTGAFPRWVAAAWLAFLVVDFGFGAVGPIDPHWLYLAGSVGLAAHLVRDGGRAWAVS